MPIKPENKGRYAADWKAIRAEIIERAARRCEGSPKFPGCRVPQYAVGQWIGQQFRPIALQATSYKEAREAADLLNALRPYWTARYVVIVLTVAHLDHQPENNGTPGNRPNLRGLCNRCHLHHDLSHHARRAPVSCAAGAVCGPIRKRGRGLMRQGAPTRTASRGLIPRGESTDFSAVLPLRPFQRRAERTARRVENGGR